MTTMLLSVYKAVFYVEKQSLTDEFIEENKEDTNVWTGEREASADQSSQPPLPGKLPVRYSILPAK